MIESLDHPAFDFYIHIDAKSDLRVFKEVLQKQRVFFVKKRATIFWGDWGTIQATLNGFEEISEKNYHYINVISGQDFPIKSPENICSFFESHAGKEFITCDFPSGGWADARSRISEYHLINWRFPGRHRIEKIITAILPARKFPLDFQLVGRANWFSLSVAAVKYCLKFLRDNPAVVSYFKLCWGADEFIFSTILYNSEFKTRIMDNLVYVDWNGDQKGHPRILGHNDIEKLRRTDKLFARKFDMHEDDSIINAIEEQLLGHKLRSLS